MAEVTNPIALGNEAAFPNDYTFPENRGLTKRELFAAIAMHAEFLSCGSLEGPAAALAESAAAAGQAPVQRMAINAIEVADALIAELAKQS